MRDTDTQKELERQWKKERINSAYGMYSSNSFKMWDEEEANRIAENARRALIKATRNRKIDELLCD